jgi:myo-inositol 2-dehydrogenase / D-chiro-inositol 1-dehydrogenase
VAAGKNIFTEKPVGVDGPGIRKVLAAYEDAGKKNLGIAAGTQRRHQAPYIETVKQIKDGAIGPIVGGRCHWNQGNIWFRTRKPQMRDLDYQVENWYHFVWLCGDHIVEQHVHNIDVINWILGQHPLRCVGMGGRTMPCADPNVDGHIYNFFSVDFEYPDGVHILSTCRQINNCAGSVSEAVVGTKGTSQVNEYRINGKQVAGRGGNNPYVQEHTDLIESLRSGKPINELKNVAESTLCSIMGRMSAYTGKEVTWEQALNSKLDLTPASYAMGPIPIPEVAVPGKTPLI